MDNATFFDTAVRPTISVLAGKVSWFDRAAAVRRHIIIPTIPSVHRPRRRRTDGYPSRSKFQKFPGYRPPSINKFWPVMYPACRPHRKAHAAPSSSGSPTRPATGFEVRCRVISFELRSLLVSNGPGSRLLIVMPDDETDGAR